MPEIKGPKQDLLEHIHKQAHRVFVSLPRRAFERPVVQLLPI